MNELTIISDAIREKRLELNLRMEDVAKEAGITRATLSSIENGSGSCSSAALFKVLHVLDINFSLENKADGNKRRRATRTNTALDKKINRFVILCVEQYAHYKRIGSGIAYKKMSKKGVIVDLVDDYEDLHGMSSEYLNDYIDALLGGRN